MKLFESVRKQHLLMGLASLFAAMVLAFIPPLEIGGFAVWFYLVPGLIASYCVPVSVMAVMIIGAATICFLGLPAGPPFILAEVVAGSVLLLGLALWRNITRRVDTLLIAATLLLVVGFPVVSLTCYYVGGLSIQQCALMGARYAVSSLISVLVAEIIVLAVTLSKGDGTLKLRELIGFRPSLVHVVEMIIGSAVTICLLVTLTLFWRSWEESLADVVRSNADFRLNTLFLSAESATDERLALGAQLAAHMHTEASTDGSLSDQASLLGAVSAFLSDQTLSGAENERAIGIAFGDERPVATAPLTPDYAERAFALARAQVAEGLISLDLRLPDGTSRPAYVRVTQDDQPDILMVFPDMADALDFTFGMPAEFFKSVYNDPLHYVESVPTADPKINYQIPESGQVLKSNELGWAIWNGAVDDSGRLGMRDYLRAVNPNTYISVMPALVAVDRFAGSLHGIEGFRITMSFWPFYERYAQAVSMSAGLGLVIFTVLLWFSRFLVGGMVKPLGELTTVFESWRQFRGGELGSGAALQAMDARGFSTLGDINSLQVGFRSLAQDVMYGERRLSTIAANYDELLRSLPLGVLAVDGSSRVQFLNDALGEITEQRQDAISRLKAQAAQMLLTNTTVDEWQLNLEDRPPKSLLLVVNHRLDDRGQESGLWVIATDLTEQKQTNAQLIQASKLATLGEMSTGMAHELNQPLNVISLATSNLRFSVKKGKNTEDNTMSKLDRIDGAVHRAASIIDHMRAYGRLAGEGLTEINVGEIVQGSCNLLSEQLKLANISLVNQVATDGIPVKGNAIQLEQVLINLINNAKDAIREGDGPGEVVVDSEVSAGRVLIRVTDTGGGIPEHALPHVFEPFFTTKPVGKGTGLGGSISYGIVREMQGDIWAENVPGGAQITISLPLLRKA